MFERTRSEWGVPIGPASLLDFAAFSLAGGDRADLNYLKTLNDVPHLREEDPFMLRLCNLRSCVWFLWSAGPGVTGGAAAQIREVAVICNQDLLWE